MSGLRVERVPRLSPAELAPLDLSFDVEAEALPPFDGPVLGNIRPVEPYRKRYPHAGGPLSTPDPAQAMLATARCDGRLVGFILVSRAWNGCGEIDDLSVDRAARRGGIARALMDTAVAWAREQQLPMLRLETQSNNVPACRFYARYGFVLGGYDRHLYDTVRRGQPHETALFWYLPLDPH